MRYCSFISGVGADLSIIHTGIPQTKRTTYEGLWKDIWKDPTDRFMVHENPYTVSMRVNAQCVSDQVDAKQGMGKILRHNLH